MKPIITLKYVFITLILFLFTSCVENQSKVVSKEDKPCCAELESAPVVSSSSIYQLNENWVDQNNQNIKLSSLKGKPQVVAMIFTNCAYACPRILLDLKQIESNLTEAQREKVEFLLITFDTVRDTPAQLKKYAKDHQLNAHWRLLHGNENQVREISLVLGVKYEQQKDKSFAHSNIITVLNQEGEIVHQQEGLGANNDQTISKIKELIK